MSKKSEVRLSDDKKVRFEGRSTIAIKTTHGNSKLICDVQLISNLANYFLSVGRLMVNSCSMLFDNDSCIVSDKKMLSKCYNCADESEQHISP